MKRLFNAHIQLAYEDKRVSASVNSPVASRTGFWWSERKTSDRLGCGTAKSNWARSSLTRSSAIPVPLDMNILKAMKRSSSGH